MGSKKTKVLFCCGGGSRGQGREGGGGRRGDTSCASAVAAKVDWSALRRCVCLSVCLSVCMYVYT
jgi:hypothetical protein